MGLILSSYHRYLVVLGSSGIDSYVVLVTSFGTAENRVSLTHCEKHLSSSIFAVCTILLEVDYGSMR